LHKATKYYSNLQRTIPRFNLIYPVISQINSFIDDDRYRIYLLLFNVSDFLHRVKKVLIISVHPAKILCIMIIVKL